MAKKASNESGAASGGSQDTKEAILRAAIDEFAEFGLAGGRVDRIAARAGFNKQALYYHYKDKEGLFEEALAYGYSKFGFAEDNWLIDIEDPVVAMSELVERIFDTVAANRNHISLIAEENKLKGKHLSGDIVEHIRDATDSARKALNLILERGQRQGVFTPDIDATDLYILLIGHPIFYFNHAYTLSCILRQDILSETRVRQQKDSIKTFFLNAITNTN